MISSADKTNTMFIQVIVGKNVINAIERNTNNLAKKAHSFAHKPEKSLSCVAAFSEEEGVFLFSSWGTRRVLGCTISALKMCARWGAWGSASWMQSRSKGNGCSFSFPSLNTQHTHSNTHEAFPLELKPHPVMQWKKVHGWKDAEFINSEHMPDNLQTNQKIDTDTILFIHV